MSDKLYNQLRNKGFLSTEARHINLIPDPLRFPWVEKLVAERRSKFRKAMKSGMTREKFDLGTVDEYLANKWTNMELKADTGCAELGLDVYAMMRSKADIYKQLHPEYESPWEAKARSLRREASAISNSYRQVATPMSLSET